MLIRYSVENFLSFNQRVVFSMIPGRGSLKNEHRSTPVEGVSALKASIILGANASGKSNLIKAINFGRQLIIKGSKPGQILDYKRYRLNTTSPHRNSRMEYEIQIGGKNYAYGFVFNNTSIVEEWLYEINKRSQKMIFERDMNSENHYNLDPILKNIKSEEDKQFVKFIAKGTPDNQLLLSEFVFRKVDGNIDDIKDIRSVFNWFLNTLKVIFPNTRYNEGIKSEISDNEKLHEMYEELLKYFGTGISGVSLKSIDLENSNIPRTLLEKIREDLMNMNSENVKSVLTINRPNYRDTIIISRDGDDIKAEKFMTKHKVSGGDEVLFETGEESDGTNRIIDFIPLILFLL